MRRLKLMIIRNEKTDGKQLVNVGGRITRKTSFQVDISQINVISRNRSGY